MVYKIDLTEPGYFWQLRKIERKTYGKTTNHSTTVRRVDKSSSGDRQGGTLRSIVRITNLGVRVQQKGVSIEENGRNDIRHFHDPYRDYGG